MKKTRKKKFDNKIQDKKLNDSKMMLNTVERYNM